MPHRRGAGRIPASKSNGMRGNKITSLVVGIGIWASHAGADDGFRDPPANKEHLDD
jgi:hypothetical protein